MDFCSTVTRQQNRIYSEELMTDVYACFDDQKTNYEQGSPFFSYS